MTLQTIAGLAAGFVVLWTVTAAFTLAAGSRSSGGFSTSGSWFYATAVTASAAEFLGARCRGSVASDLMEPLRPIVDEVVLELLTTRELARGYAVDTQVGVCCLGAESCPTACGVGIATAQHPCTRCRAPPQQAARGMGLL